MKFSIVCTLSSWPRHRRTVCSLSIIGSGIVFNWSLNEFRKACCTAVMECFLVSRELYAELLKPSPNVSISFFITFSRISSCCFNKSVLFNSSPAKFYLFNSFKSKIYLNQDCSVSKLAVGFEVSTTFHWNSCLHTVSHTAFRLPGIGNWILLHNKPLMSGLITCFIALYCSCSKSALVIPSLMLAGTTTDGDLENVILSGLLSVISPWFSSSTFTASSNISIAGAYNWLFKSPIAILPTSQTKFCDKSFQFVSKDFCCLLICIQHKYQLAFCLLCIQLEMIPHLEFPWQIWSY